MAKPVTDTVFFSVTVRSRARGDHWFADTFETGLIAYGDTREEAEARNGEANEALVRHVKGAGKAALARFMEERGLSYVIGARRSQPTPSPQRCLAA